MTKVIKKTTKTFGKKAKRDVMKLFPTIKTYRKVQEDYKVYYIFKDENKKMLGYFHTERMADQGNIYSV